MANSRELYARLLGYLKPYRLAFILGILCIALLGATEPLLPALLKPLLDKGFGGASPDYLWKAPLGVILLFLLRGILSYTGGYLTSWVSNRIITDVRIAMFDRILRLPTRYYDDQSTGILMSKVTYDVSNVTNAATSVLNVAVKDSLNVIGR
jgi:subfamily B ATP-binding cassette protein MsbA